MTILRASLLVLLLAGCTTTKTVIPTLPLPPEPVLPTIKAEELEGLREGPDGLEPCLSDATYEALVVRDATLKAYAKRLRAIIEAHNAQGQE